MSALAVLFAYGLAVIVVCAGMVWTTSRWGDWS